MKLETYNYIKQCLEMGHMVRVKRYDDSWYTIVCFEDPILFAVARSGSHCTADDEYALKIFTDEYEIIPRIPKVLQPGEKCYIIDTEETREFTHGWSSDYKKMLGKTYEILRNTYGFYSLKENGYRFPYFMVAPIPPEENKLEFVECENCSKQVGAISLCNSCISNRNLFESLKVKLADVDTTELSKELENRGLLVNGKVLK